MPAPIDPENPLYHPSEVEQMFDHSIRSVIAWLARGWVPEAYQTPSGFWKIPEAGLEKALVELGWPRDEVRQRFEEYKASLW